jgi:uncharacterized membrane protein
MEIRNRDDAEFILRHRALKELGKQWKKKGRIFYFLLAPLAIYLICMMVTFPHSGEAGYGDLPEAVTWGFIVLMVWLAVPALVAGACYEKDKELLTKKYMDEATEAGTIDKEQDKK